MGTFQFMEHSSHFSRLRVQGTDRERSTSTFPNMKVISTLGSSLCNSKICCFQIHFVIFHRNIQMAAIMLQTIPSIYANFSEKSFFTPVETYENYFVCKDYCIAHHNDKTCSLPVCKNHIILFEEIEELLQKVDTFCFTYQSVDCFYTLFKCRFNGKGIAKSGQVFDNVQRAVDFNQRNNGVDRMPSIAKKRLLWKKLKKHLFSSFQKTKTTQTSGSVFAGRIEKVKKTKFELHLIKIVDCFSDGHGNYDTNLVSFKIKSL